MRRSRHALWLLLVATPAFAQDAPDFGALAKFIRWGGVLASVVVLGAIFIWTAPEPRPSGCRAWITAGRAVMRAGSITTPGSTRKVR